MMSTEVYDDIRFDGSGESKGGSIMLDRLDGGVDSISKP